MTENIEKDKEEATDCLVNAASFITNSDSVIRYEGEAVDTISDLIELHGAQVERLALGEISCRADTLRLAKAVRENDTISSLYLYCGAYSVPIKSHKLVRLMTSALESKSLRSFALQNMNLEPAEMSMLCDPLRVSSLTEVRISHSPPTITKELIVALSRISTLQSLCFEYVNCSLISLLASSVPTLAAAIPRWPQLKELRLSRARIGIVEAKMTGEALRKSNADCLVVIDFTYSNLLDEGVEAIIAGMLAAYDRRKVKEGALLELNLGSNNFADRGCLKLGELLKRSPHLERLDISNNPSITPAMGVALGKLLSQTCAKSLTSLNVEKCKFPPEVIAAICYSLSGSPSLRHLNIGSNDTIGKGIQAVVDELLTKACIALETLNLSDNELSPEDAKTLARGFRDCRCPLKYFFFQSSNARRVITWNSTTKFLSGWSKGTGTAELIDALPNSLCEVNLSECGVDDQGAEAVGRLIKRSHCIRKITLRKNKFHTASTMLQAAAESESLMHIDLEDNMLGLEGAQVAAEIMSKCRSLQYLNIRLIGMGSRGADVLAKAAVMGRERFVQKLSTMRTIAVGRSDVGNYGYAQLKGVEGEVPGLKIDAY